MKTGSIIAMTILLGSLALPEQAAAHPYTAATDGNNTATVVVGTSDSTAGTPGNPGTPGRNGAGGASNACPWVPLPEYIQQVLSPGGPQPGKWYVLGCLALYGGKNKLVWVPDQLPATPATPSVSPYAVASQAAASLSLPFPAIELSPPRFGVVNLPVWLWIGAGAWHAERATAAVQGVSATVVATPVQVDWSMGDGTQVVCEGPGAPYDPNLPGSAQWSSCTHTYRVSSLGQPSPDGNPNDAAFVVRAAITWDVSWTSSTGDGGTLPPLTTSSTRLYRVEQVETVEAG
jgi:hypothetical protein